jgi:hypothetical protein
VTRFQGKVVTEAEVGDELRRRARRLSIEQMQKAIYAKGWQWLEHVFNDLAGGNCMLEFTQDPSPHALSTYPRPADCLGWGRFGRRDAWTMAYNRLAQGGN